jgi:hypothetical protein
MPRSQMNSLKARLSEAAGKWLDLAEQVKQLPEVDTVEISGLIETADEAMQAVEDCIPAL